MMDYKTYLDKLFADLYKKFDEDEERKESIKVLTTNFDKSFKQLEEITNTLKEADLKMDDPFIPNTKFMELMEISTRTAQVWRDEEKIGYSQIAGKIYYRKSDIEKLLNDNYHKAKEKGGNKR